MKPWIKLCVVATLASATVVRADIDFSHFNFKPFMTDRKYHKKNYIEEQMREIPMKSAQVASVESPPRPRVKLAQATSASTNDAGPVVTITSPLGLTQQVRADAATDTHEADRAVVTANVWVELHETEVGLKLANCDREINEKYSDPPLHLECVSEDEGTRYVAKSNRPARDGAYIWNYKMVTWTN